MASSKLVELIRRLIGATEAGKVKWAAAPQGKRFFAELGSGRVSINRQDDADGLYIHVTITNEDGVVVERLNDEDIPEISFSELETFYDNVRIQALGLDKTIDSMINALE